jgi:hypothetical protein
MRTPRQRNMVVRSHRSEQPATGQTWLAVAPASSSGVGHRQSARARDTDARAWLDGAPVRGADSSSPASFRRRERPGECPKVGVANLPMSARSKKRRDARSWRRNSFRQAVSERPAEGGKAEGSRDPPRRHAWASTAPVQARRTYAYTRTCRRYGGDPLCRAIRRSARTRRFAIDWPRFFRGWTRASVSSTGLLQTCARGRRLGVCSSSIERRTSALDIGLIVPNTSACRWSALRVTWVFRRTAEIQRVGATGQRHARTAPRPTRSIHERLWDPLARRVR